MHGARASEEENATWANQKVASQGLLAPFVNYTANRVASAFNFTTMPQATPITQPPGRA